jgi:hypothetical protein
MPADSLGPRSAGVEHCAQAGKSNPSGPLFRNKLQQCHNETTEIGTMSAKLLPALVAGLLLGTTALASAQVVYAPYGYNYNYYGYAGAYPPAVTLGPGIGPGIYYAPGYYNYAPAPAYVAPAYTGWNNALWNYW